MAMRSSSDCRHRVSTSRASGALALNASRMSAGSFGRPPGLPDRPLWKPPLPVGFVILHTGTGAVEVPVLPTLDAPGGPGWDPKSMHRYREMFRVAGDYCFNQLGVQRVTARTRAAPFDEKRKTGKLRTGSMRAVAPRPVLSR